MRRDIICNHIRLNDIHLNVGFRLKLPYIPPVLYTTTWQPDRKLSRLYIMVWGRRVVSMVWEAGVRVQISTGIIVLEVVKRDYWCFESIWSPSWNELCVYLNKAWILSLSALSPTHPLPWASLSLSPPPSLPPSFLEHLYLNSTQIPVHKRPFFKSILPSLNASGCGELRKAHRFVSFCYCRAYLMLAETEAICIQMATSDCMGHDDGWRRGKKITLIAIHFCHEALTLQ